MSIKWIETREELEALDWEIDGVDDVINDNTMDSNDNFNKALEIILKRFQEYNGVILVEDALEHFRDNFIDYYGTAQS